MANTTTALLVARSYEVLLNLSSTGEAGASATPPVSISGPDDWVTGSKSANRVRQTRSLA